MKKKDSNLLDYIPIKNEKYTWKERENGLISIIVKREGKIDKLMQKIFNTPKRTIIDLDETGSLVWKNIDGKKSVEEIGSILKKYSNSNDSVYERLAQYIQILSNNNFIIFKK
ncbi:PqqD family protein [Tepidibacter formicigenes]|uniref:Coenzyme PQQ synthesis protein D (PqqD) n=1 Tax=Tepidibacter formicigenes DSM 15518 TaxID=1123349 RepID=A0A1M6NRR9_9FIRM|nr:PqqD family protein [Tepidibacter formicigenes]SHJ98394.1 Coenzyme PQQ synthesis protein D (PqqD) [Tepidibacter formicigenes DSM 15518]